MSILNELPGRSFMVFCGTCKNTQRLDTGLCRGNGWLGGMGVSGLGGNVGSGIDVQGEWCPSDSGGMGVSWLRGNVGSGIDVQGEWCPSDSGGMGVSWLRGNVGSGIDVQGEWCPSDSGGMGVSWLRGNVGSGIDVQGEWCPSGSGGMVMNFPPPPPLILFVLRRVCTPQNPLPQEISLTVSCIDVLASLGQHCYYETLDFMLFPSMGN